MKHSYLFVFALVAACQLAGSEPSVDSASSAASDDAALRARFAPRDGAAPLYPHYGDVDGDGRNDAIVATGEEPRIELWSVVRGSVVRTASFPVPHLPINLETLGNGMIRTWRGATEEEARELQCSMGLAEETWRIEGNELVRIGAPKIVEDTACEHC